MAALVGTADDAVARFERGFADAVEARAAVRSHMDGARCGRFSRRSTSSTPKS